MKRRNLILLLGGASSGAMSVGTGAFSSVSAERDVEVNVVEDEDAYVGYSASDKSVTSGTEIDLVTVENRFPGDVELEITDVKIDADDGLTIEPVGERESFTPDDSGENEFTSGETDTIRGEVHCETDSTGEVAVTVTVEATGIAATLFGDTRKFEVTCIEPVSGVTFRGSGNADAHAGGRTLEAKAWFVETDNSDDLDFEETPVGDPFDWDTTEKMKKSFSGDPSGKLVAIRFPETNQTFVNPDYTVNSDKLPKSW